MPSKPLFQPVARHRDRTPLEDRVLGALMRLPFARSVECETRGGIVVLTGVLPSYYQTRCAEDVVKGLEGVAQIDNRIMVRAA
ncbi:MAG: BON domain-containing protein [Planctomycetes bacterium]|nr:BON domain-containing protein [Planctomycetota bacterium]